MANVTYDGDDGGSPDAPVAAPPPPPPAPYRPWAPYSPTPYSPYSRSGGKGPQTSRSAPVDHAWDGVAAGYKSEIEDLALQWQQVAGFSVTIDEATLRKMADAHVVSMRDFGLWMWNNGPGMTDEIKQRSPWLAWGLDQTTFNRQLSDYEDTYEQLTGQRVAFDPAVGKQMDMASNFLWEAFRNNLTQSGLREELMHDETIRNTYGWIKFGLTFDDFQQRKVDMRIAFGQDLSNDQAMLQLQYLHQAQGANRAVTAPAPQGQQQGPVTPTEVTVR